MPTPIIIRRKRGARITPGSGGGEFLGFSGYTKPQSTPTVELGGLPGIRDQDVFEIDANTWGMVAMVGGTGGTPGVRLGIRYWTAPKNDPHNWTLQPGYLIESDTGSWDVNIDACSAPFFDTSDSLWKIWYSDYSAGMVGYAYKSGDFGIGFTKYASNPVIDNTASVGAFNQYIRHVCGFKLGSTYYLFYEGRDDDPEGETSIHSIGKATSSDGINWTLDTDPIWDTSDEIFIGTYLQNNGMWMPDVKQLSNGKFYMVFSVYGNDSNGDGGHGEGFGIAVSEDISDNANWQILTSQRPIIKRMQPYTDFDSFSNEEMSWFEESGNIWLYNNGAPQNTGHQVGRYLLNKGTFDDTIQPSILEDGFNDESLDISKWTYTPSGGMSVTEEDFVLKISGDGSSDSLTEILRGKSGVNSVSDEVWTLTFNYARDTFDGGDCIIGMSNAAGTNIVSIRNQATGLNRLILDLTIGGVSLYNEIVDFDFTDGDMVQIKKTGHVISFWRWDNPTSAWVNITANGTLSFNPKFVEASTWTEDQIFPVVLASNDGTDAFEVRLNNLSLKTYDHPGQSPFIIGGIQFTYLATIFGRLTNLSTQERDAIIAFVTAEVDNWALIDEFFLFKLNSTDAPVGWGSATGAATGATHVANGYDFDGNNDFFDTNQIPSNGLRYQQDDAQLGFYIHTIGDQTSTRVLRTSNDGVRTTSVFQDATNIKFRINQGLTGNRDFPELFQSDTIYSFIRDGAAATNLKVYKNGVLQTGLTNGDISTGRPTTESTIGSNAARNANWFDGLIGVAWTGAAVGFDHESWNTSVRQLLSDLD